MYNKVQWTKLNSFDLLLTRASEASVTLPNYDGRRNKPADKYYRHTNYSTVSHIQHKHSNTWPRDYTKHTHGATATHGNSPDDMLAIYNCKPKHGPCPPILLLIVSRGIGCSQNSKHPLFNYVHQHTHQPAASITRKPSNHLCMNRANILTPSTGYFHRQTLKINIEYETKTYPLSVKTHLILTIQSPMGLPS